MKALLIVAHGSRVVISNDEIRTLTKSIAAQQNQYDMVDCAFLELAEPSIQSGCEKLINAGATEVIVMPYFLAAGKHVNSDIPDDLEATRAAHPQVEITMMPYFGSATGVVSELLQQIDHFATG